MKTQNVASHSYDPKRRVIAAKIPPCTVEKMDTIAARLASEEPSGRPNLWSALGEPRVLALGIAYLAFNTASYGIYLWLPQIVKAMRLSNVATGFVLMLCFVAGIPAMILCGRASSRWGERIWHVALPWLLAASCLAAASLTQSNGFMFAALAIGLAAQFAPFGAFFSLP